jgi:hypothetical protein
MSPFDKIKPAIINFEILNLTRGDTNAVYHQLMDIGYRLHESGMDCTAYLNSACKLE